MKGVILLIVLLLIAGAFIYENYGDKDIDLGNFKIKSRQLKTLTDAIPNGEYVLCSIKDNDCVRMNKENLDS